MRKPFVRTFPFPLFFSLLHLRDCYTRRYIFSVVTRKEIGNPYI